MESKIGGYMNENQEKAEFVENICKRFNNAQLVEWHERAAIYEYEANFSREDAEYMACLDIIKQIAQSKRRRTHGE